MLTGRRVTLAVILGIALVFGLAGWRFLSGENQTLSIARPPVVTTARPQTPTAITDSSASLNQLDLSHQLLVDDLQLLQGRVTSQEMEIKRLRSELLALSQKYETLSSFASTLKEANQPPDVQPPKTTKKRFVKRSKKR